MANSKIPTANVNKECAVHIRTKISAAGLSVAVLAGLGAPAHASTFIFANYSQADAASDITWYNVVTPAVTKLIPAVTKLVPAVTKVIPAVTKVTPAVTQFIPAVTKIVAGKLVVVTPARTVVITPAKTVIVTPAKTVVVTPAHTVVVTPARTVIVTAAHDTTNGTVFSTTAANADAYGLAKVKFNFLNKTLAKAIGAVDATFSFEGATPAKAPAVKIGALLSQPDISGTFAFTYTGAKALHVWDSTYLTGANLLSGTFTKLTIGGARGAATGGMLAFTDTGGLVDFTSDILDFDATVSRQAAFSLTSISPALDATAGNALHSFKSGSGGAFSSNPAPRLTAVPEPASWVLMIGGFGLAGGALRARRRVVRATS